MILIWIKKILEKRLMMKGLKYVLKKENTQLANNNKKKDARFQLSSEKYNL